MTLLNPRLAIAITLSFDELIRLLAGGKSKVELLEIFAFLVSERKFQH